ncbi:MAG TPA: outer membrane lipoprotein-sorting protein [Spirochaetia bacterium]|nr:outer membrane lipoprotein-sorting protein [Spirochaetia bacterium]
MKTAILPIAAALAVLLSPARAHAEAPAESPARILARSDALRTIDDMSFEVNLSAYTGDHVTDTARLWGSLKIGTDHNRLLMYFADPPSDRGRKLLVDGNAVYLLFVRTTNPVRISPLEVLTGQASDGDVIRTFARDYDVASMDPASRNGVPVYHFSLVAKPGTGDASYPHVQLWMETATLRLVYAEFYAASGVLLKKATYRDYRAAVGKDVPFTVEVLAGDDATKRTVMTFDKVGRKVVPETAFRRSYLATWTPEEPR